MIGVAMTEEKDNIFIGDLPPDTDENIVRTTMDSIGTVVKMRFIPPSATQGNSSALVQFASVDEAKWAVENLNGTTPPGFTAPLVIKFAENPNDKLARQFGKSEGKSGGKDRLASLAPYPAGGKGWNSQAALSLLGDTDPFSTGAVAGAPRFGFGKGMKAAGKKGARVGMGGVSALTALQQMEAQGLIPSTKHAPPDCVAYVKNLPPDCTDLELYRMFSPFGALSSCRAIWQDDGSCKGYGFVNFVEPAGAQVAIATLNGFQMTNGSILGVEIKKASGGPAMPSEPRMSPGPPMMATSLLMKSAGGLGNLVQRPNPAASAAAFGTAATGAAAAAATTAPAATAMLDLNATGAAADASGLALTASLGDVLNLGGNSAAGCPAASEFEQQMRLLQMQLHGV